MKNQSEDLQNLSEELKSVFDESTEDKDKLLSDETDDDSLLIESCALPLDEKSIKTYWTDETESGIIDFLCLNEFFYENRIKEEIENAKKSGRAVNKRYCDEMQRKMDDVLLITDRFEQREKIFKKSIETPLKKLVENILFNFNLILPGIDAKSQQKDCYTFIYTKFANFNPWMKTKSFSYFGTIAKHYYLGGRKDHAKSTKVLYDYESNKEEADNSKIEEPKPYRTEDSSLDLFNFIINCLERDLDKDSLSDNDKKVGNAIIDIFRNHETIKIYNKTQIYQLIKDNTYLDPKDITYSLHRFRILYKSLKKEFIESRED